MMKLVREQEKEEQSVTDGHVHNKGVAASTFWREKLQDRYRNASLNHRVFPVLRFLLNVVSIVRA